MNLDTVHHVAIIGRNYEKTRDFMSICWALSSWMSTFGQRKRTFSSMSEREIWFWKFLSRRKRPCGPPSHCQNIQVFVILPFGFRMWRPVWQNLTNLVSPIRACAMMILMARKWLSSLTQTGSPWKSMNRTQIARGFHLQ